MSRSKIYITTPIYYVNAQPHIGHAYTTILADVLARCHRMRGVPTHFLTGTDERGQKIQQAAGRAGMTAQQHADATVVRFQELWRRLEITNDDFIRTTELRRSLGLPAGEPDPGELARWGRLAPGTMVQPLQILFPRNKGAF